MIICFHCIFIVVSHCMKPYESLGADILYLNPASLNGIECLDFSHSHLECSFV